MKHLYILLFFCLYFSQSNARLRIAGVDPINGVVAFKSYFATSINVNQFYISYNQKDTCIGKLKFIIGDTIVPPKAFIYVSVKGLNYSDGYIALHDLRTDSTIGVSSTFMDYMQWGSAGHRFEGLADSTFFMLFDTIKMQADTVRRWPKGTFVTTAPPYTFTGGSLQSGVAWWQSYKLPKVAIKIIEVVPSLGQIKLKNIGTSNIDVSALIICVKNNCIDSLKFLTVVKGSLNIPKNDTLTLAGLTLNDALDNVSLFFPINVKDTVNLLDFVQWGGYAGGFSYIAHHKKFCDSLDYINSLVNDTLYYRGDYTRSQYGLNFWEAFHSKDTTHYGIYQSGENNFNFSLFPNPANEQLSLNLQSHIVSISIHLYNSNGQLVYNELAYDERKIINTSLLPSGIYYITISQNGEGYRKRKLIIEH